jgi:hypothetical protein
MNPSSVDGIVNALLYEGYILYPYRSSAVKNQRRWYFGIVYPRAYAEAQTGADAWTMKTECVVIGSRETSVDTKVRFLRVIERTAGLETEGEVEARPCVEAGGRIYESWQEAVEHCVSSDDCCVGSLADAPMFREFRVPAERNVQRLGDGAVLVRTSEAISGMLKISAQSLADGVFRLTVEISNVTAFAAGEHCTREQALSQSLLSAHTVLSARQGEFASLLEPPEDLREATEGCRNLGTWPVLVGEGGRRDMMLSSPIILYDYPQVAPESPGNLFDGGEIDEILTLRILTLTDGEKAAMRRSDEHASQMLDRVESLPAEHFMKLHGVLREASLNRRGGNL